MTSSIDSKAALTAMASVLTAYTSAVGVSTATFATAISNQISVDTGLTATEQSVATLISSAIGSITPSSNINQGMTAIQNSFALRGHDFSPDGV